MSDETDDLTPPPSRYGFRLGVDRVDPELARLWEEEAQRSHTSRVVLYTVIALVAEPRLLDRARRSLAELVRVHPSRTIAAVWVEGDNPVIHAEVALHVDPTRGRVACGDAIALEACGEARTWLPETIDRLVLSGVPSCLWWVGDLPDGDDLFDLMVRRADVALVNSAEMDLRDLEKLSRIASDVRHAKTALLDLTWVRLRPLQDLVARFFDDPAILPHLSAVSQVKLSYAPRPNEQDVASTQVGLFLGWLAAALRWKLASPGRWSRSPAGGGSVALQAPSGEIEVAIDHEPRPDVPEGALTKIELVAASAGARFEVARLDDPDTFRCCGEASGVVVPTQTVRVHPHVESRFLARALERPAHDELLEASLAAAYKIVRPVAPRFSERPPRDI